MTAIRWIFIIALLTLIYAMTLASFDPLDLIIGAIFSLGTLLLFRGFLFASDQRAEGRDEPSLFRRIIAFFPFAAWIVWDITRGTWAVALIVIGIRPLHSPGIILVPIGDRTPTGVAVSGIATTLSPGTVLVDVDWNERVMLIHTFDASDPDGLRAEFQYFYDRYQRHVFP
jgi:multicomponent Na+:H+ antiporter subunit E